MTEYKGINIDAAELLILRERTTHPGRGYTFAHDGGRGLELARAASAYVHEDRNIWPWSSNFWRPRSRIENLVRAGALYLAAIDAYDPTPVSAPASLVDNATNTAWLLQRELNALAELVEVTAVPESVGAVIAAHQMVPVTAGQRQGEHENVLVNGYRCSCGMAVFPERDADGKPVDGSWFLGHLEQQLVNGVNVAARPRPLPSRSIGSRFD